MAAVVPVRELDSTEVVTQYGAVPEPFRPRPDPSWTMTACQHASEGGQRKRPAC